MPTKKTAPKTAKPKPPKLLRVHYRVARDIVVELAGNRFIFRAHDPRGLRRSKPLTVDADTWDKLAKKPAVKALIERGDIRRIAK